MNTSDASSVLLSVIIPVRNGALWLGETLESIYAQTESNFEILLIDDASTDHLQQVIDRHPDNRLQLIHLPFNMGVSAARNYGITLARGRYIALCDADDLCLPHRFEVQLNFLEKNLSTGLCGSAFTCFEDVDLETVSHPLTHEIISKKLMMENCFGLSTVMARASVLKSYPFDAGLSVAEDYDLWTRLVINGVRVANLPDNLVRYRVHLQQASRHKGEVLDQVARKIRANYCLSCLNETIWTAGLTEREIEWADLARCASSVKACVDGRRDYSAMDFRFLLAWLYQKQADYGLWSWLRWTRIQRELLLSLDRNYKFNIALLAFLPNILKRKYANLLIKLKR